MAEGEVVELEEALPSDVEETADGGAIIRLEEGESEEVEDFYANIADQFDEPFLDALATKYLDLIEKDVEARKLRRDQYAEAIKRTGLGREAPGGANFPGASRAVHPMLIEACVEFEARAIRELFPPNGPVRTYIPDEATVERMEKAERKKNFMNWQFLTQMPEFRPELEQLLMQLPLGGTMYLRLTPDYSKRRPRPLPVFVPLDKVSIPYSATSFATAQRQTYHETITQAEFEERIREGIYRDISSIFPGQSPEETAPEKASDRVEGKESNPENVDGDRIAYEVSCFEKLEDSVGIAPYLISIDSVTRKVLSIVRNWEEGDEDLERMQWMIDFTFIPWRGALGIGLGHLIGMLSGAATGALRALLDSAHINNIPTAVRLKGANFSGQSKELNATQIVEIEGGVVGDQDIRKLLMPLPFNGPSETLLKLLGVLTEAGRGMLQVALDKMAEGNPNMPVGTTLALIEEGMRVLSAVHLRLYHSMTQVLKVLHRINRMYLTEEDLVDEVGTVIAKRSDFEDPLDVIPVADPEIFSDVQRMAQIQIVADRAIQQPDIYNRRAVELRLLERTKIPNPEELLIPEPKPEDMNQANENVAMALGQPVAAFPEQDHLAHIQILLDFLTSPMFGRLPIIAPSFIPAALNHLKEHLVLWYVNEFYEMTKREMGLDEGGIEKVLAQRDPQTRAELDRLLASESAEIVQRAQEQFAKVPEVIQQAQQLLQELGPQGMPQLPIDPNRMEDIKARKEIEQQRLADRERDRQARREEKVIELEARREEAERRREIEFTKLSAREQEMALKEAEESARQATEWAARLKELATKESAEDKRHEAKLRSEERRNSQDNLTATMIASAEIESSERVGVSTGKGVKKDQNPSGGKRR